MRAWRSTSLALVAGFVATAALGGRVDLQAPNGIVATNSEISGQRIELLTISGEVWHFISGEWTHYSNHDPPIPVFSIVWWEGSVLIDVSGDLWSSDGPSWMNHGQIPTSISVSETETPVAPAHAVPNPGHTSIRVEIPEELRGRARTAVVFDPVGKRLDEIAIVPGLDSFEWDASRTEGRLSSGVYMIVLMGSDGPLSVSRAVILR